MAQKSYVGLRSGKLVAIEKLQRNTKTNYLMYRCKCDCGRICDVRTSSLKSGSTKSCGCSKGEFITKANLKHGCAVRGSRSGEYISWAKAKQRCSVPGSKDFHYYGGRGIKMCLRWSGENGFANFLSDMGPRPDGYSIERIDHNGDYEPSNCKWIPTQEQMANRRSVIPVTYRGMTKTIAEWARLMKMPYITLYTRVKRGFSEEDTFKGFEPLPDELTFPDLPDKT